MVDLEPRMSFRKFTLQRDEVTQGGVEGAQGTLDPPLEPYSTPKTMCVIPLTAVQECAALFRFHSTSSQNLNKSRGVSSLDRQHREFPHWQSLSMDVGPRLPFQGYHG